MRTPQACKRLRAVLRYTLTASIVLVTSGAAARDVPLGLRVDGQAGLLRPDTGVDLRASPALSLDFPVGLRLDIHAALGVRNHDRPSAYRLDAREAVFGGGLGLSGALWSHSVVELRGRGVLDYLFLDRRSACRNRANSDLIQVDELSATDGGIEFSDDPSGAFTSGTGAPVQPIACDGSLDAHVLAPGLAAELHVELSERVVLLTALQVHVELTVKQEQLPNGVSAVVHESDVVQFRPYQTDVFRSVRTAAVLGLRVELP